MRLLQFPDKVTDLADLNSTAPPGSSVLADAIYHEARATAAMRQMPRFGHSKNFSALFESKEQQNDYIAGLLFAGLLLFSLFFAWSCALLILKCIGPKKMGYLAGAPFTEPRLPESNLETVPERKRRFPRAFCSCAPNIRRGIFALLTLIFIIFAVLFVTNGLTNLHNTVVTVINSSRSITNVTSEVDRLMFQLQDLSAKARTYKESFSISLEKLQETCPAFNLTAALTNGTSNASATVQSIEGTVNSLGAVTYENVGDFDEATGEIIDSSEDLTKTTENIALGDWQALVILIPYIFFPLLLLIGVILAWLKMDIPQYRCALHYVVLPIFIVMVVFAYVFASAILMAASANADFCSGGEDQNPDESIIEILRAIGYQEDEFSTTVFVYYINQCVDEDPFSSLHSFLEKLVVSKAEIQVIYEQGVFAVNQTLAEVCPSDDVYAQAADLSNSLQLLIDTVLDALYLMRCRNIVPLYTIPVYQGSCTYSINGVTWAFASFTVVGVAGLLMIMLRSSWQLDVPHDSYDGEGKAVIGGDEDVDEERCEEYEPYAGDEHEDALYSQPFSRDGDSKTDDPQSDDEWLQPEFTVPADVRLDEDNTVATADVASIAGSRRPQHYASPF